MCVFVTWEHVLGLFALPEVPPVEGGLWPSLPTHSPSWESARKRGQGAHHRALQHPGAERVYKRRNTDGSSVSVVKSSTTELRHVCRYYPGGVTESRIWRLIRGVAHHTLRSLDPSSAWRDGTTEYEEETLVQSMKGTHRDEFWGWIHQDKTFLAWDQGSYTWVTRGHYK